MRIPAIALSCLFGSTVIPPATNPAVAVCVDPFRAAPQDAKADLNKKLEEINQEDPAQLFQVALWADQNNLKTDSKRLLRKVIKLDPDHADARALLGYEKFNGKWLTEREIEREKAKAEEADMLAKGLRKWKNEWVPAEDYENLEKGLVKVEVDGAARWVTPIEKERIDKGMALFNGVWVTAEEKEHLARGEFRVGDRWVTEEEADKVHADFTNPWEFEGDLCSLTTTCTYKFGQQALRHSDASIRQAYAVLGREIPKEPAKVALIMVKDQNDYTQLGQGVNDTLDADMSTFWSTFILSDENAGRLIGVTLYESPSATDTSGNDNFSLGHVRYAAVLAALRNMKFEEPLPPWFTIGMAAYCERYWHPIEPSGKKLLAAWSIDSLNKEGGPLPLKNYFDSFAVTKQTVLQSGLLFSYLLNGTVGPKIEEQWKKCLAATAADKQKGLSKEFVRLEILLAKDGEKELDAYRTSVRG